MDKKTMRLTEQEAGILRDICFARIKVMCAGDPQNLEDIPLQMQLTEPVARQALIVFDFFRSAMSGNTEAVKRQVASQKRMGSHACGEYYDAMVTDYQKLMEGLMNQGHHTVDDVWRLQYRMKGFLKAQKNPPSQILYIADCHFYHNRLCQEMDKRGFSGFEEMNEHMIMQWNQKVRPKDDVYILGDFSIAKADATAKILGRLNGKLHLIIGNHDKYLDDKRFDRDLFRSVDHYCEIRDNGRLVILSHYPLFCYKGQYRKDNTGRPLSFMLYGHVHNTHDEKLVNRFIMETRGTKVMSKHSTEPEPIPCNMINCFCMFSDYQPMTLKEWIEIDQKRRGDML